MKKLSCKKKCPFFRAFGYCVKYIGEECYYKKGSADMEQEA